MLAASAAGADIGAAANTHISVGTIATATTDGLETAIEAGGALRTVFGATEAGDALLFLYDNGVNSTLALVSTNAAIANGATAAAGTLTATNLIQFNGIADTGSFAAGDFTAFVA